MTHGRTSFPQVQPFYAVKCNEDPALVKTLAALGTGFDCGSKVYKFFMTVSVMNGLCIFKSHFFTFPE